MEIILINKINLKGNNFNHLPVKTDPILNALNASYKIALLRTIHSFINRTRKKTVNSRVHTVQMWFSDFSIARVSHLQRLQNTLCIIGRIQTLPNQYHVEIKPLVIYPNDEQYGRRLFPTKLNKSIFSLKVSWKFETSITEATGVTDASENGFHHLSLCQIVICT